MSPISFAASASRLAALADVLGMPGEIHEMHKMVLARWLLGRDVTDI